MNLRIANWNMERPLNNTKKTFLALNKIAEINADILVLTETSNAINLSTLYPYCISTISFERTPTEQWVAIWSKFEIKNQIKTFDSHRTVCCTINSSLGEIIIYGNIIPYHMAGVSGVRYGSLNYKPWQFHEEDLFNQANDWECILNKNIDIPFFIIGDFNQTRGINTGYGTKRVKNILSQLLEKLNLICITEQNHINAFLGIDLKTGKKRNNIDHICLSKFVLNNIISYKVGAWNHFTAKNEYMSDHNGIYVDLKN